MKRATQESQVVEELAENPEPLEKLVAPQAEPWDWEIIVGRVIFYGSSHIAALYGLYLCFVSAKWATIIFNCLVYAMAELGVTAGAHRLWSHRSYKATTPLQIILVLFHSMSAQYTVSYWVRDHRLHHRHSDTDADPHNAARGMFFSHVGHMLVKKHPEVARRGTFTDISDIRDNPVLRFQDKYYIPLNTVLCFLLPTVIPMYFWGETLNTAWHVAMFRFVMNLNMTFTINSLAHYLGTRPYDKSIYPSQNSFVSLVTLGEGFHNYHHVYPWDYSAGELGNNWLNLSTKFIDFFAWIGWAYDLKTVPKDIVMSRAARTGDGGDTWGWRAEISK